MRKPLMLVVCLLAGSQFLTAQSLLPITQVLLYKNGMAYIVRSGQLDVPASLTFHPEDMNDVLKSFSAWNPESGKHSTPWATRRACHPGIRSGAFLSISGQC